MLNIITNKDRLIEVIGMPRFLLTATKAIATEGARPMERAIDGILIGAMVGIAFLANYSYLMS